MDDRWRRLERYARWKSNRLHLDHLPGDVLDVVSTHLDGVDLCNLLEALSERRATMLCREDVLSVPSEVRCKWMVHLMAAHVQTFLFSLANVALEHLRTSQMVHAYVDWSPFASRRSVMPRPLAEYSWRPGIGGRSLPNVEIDDAVMRGVLLRHLHARLPCMTVGLYRFVRRVPILVMAPKPLLMTTYQLYPAYLA